jgi:predicted nuclease of predicted toxin-antitoxin system
MHILANENLPLDAVVLLRSDGHDVWWVRSEAPGMTDREVLHRATLDDRLIVTFDKDFGELAFNARLSVTTGIVLFAHQSFIIRSTCRICESSAEVSWVVS